MTRDEFLNWIDCLTKDAYADGAHGFQYGANTDQARAALLAAWDALEAERDRLAERFITRDFFEKEWMPVLRAAESRADRLAAALLAVSTDNAQDALEDPIGHAEREASGFYRIGKGAMNAVRAALREEPPGAKEED